MNNEINKDMQYIILSNTKYYGIAPELLDYITNLQEELKYQKQAEQEYNEKHIKLIKKYKELQQRICKAVELIEDDYFEDGSFSNEDEVMELLKGSEDSEK